MKKTILSINIGDITGDLKIKEFIKKDKNSHKIYKVECLICGREKYLKDYQIRQEKGIYHSSCGRGLKTLDKKFYQHWQNMRTRTTNSKYEYYHRYGGRGINSDDFIYFIDFYDALYKSYLEHINIYGVENTTLERKDTNDNYSKDNCIWATWNIQHSNTSKNKYFKAISPDNKEYISKNQCEFARRHNLSSKQINACLNGRFKTHLGWRFEYIK